MSRRIILPWLALVAAGCAATGEPAPPTAAEARVTAFFESFDGARLTYSEAGPVGREAPTVVLLHGLTSSARSNFVRSGLVDDLVAAGFRVIAPDLRGHGRSRIGNVDANWPEDAMARDLAALLQTLDLRPDAVVGYSMGALVALRWQVLDGPSGLMVLSGMGEMTALGRSTERHDTLQRLIGSVADGARGPVQARIRALLAASGSDADSVAGSLRRRMTVTEAELAAMDLPVLVLSGAEDFDNGDGAALAALLPRAAFRTVPGDHLSAPQGDAYRDALVGWLTERLEP